MAFQLRRFVVPPGGFAGFSQMTPASKAALSPRGVRPVGSRRRKGRVQRASAPARSRAPRKLKFGSPAWRAKYAAKAKRNAAKARRAGR